MSLPGHLKRNVSRMRLAVVLLAGISAPVLCTSDVMAQSDQQAAQLTLRIQNLEQEVRDLTGQVQGLQFQLTQLQTLLDRSNQDNDFRFKQLEGGKGGGGSAPPSSRSSAPGPSGALSAPVTVPDVAPTRLASTDGGGGDGLGPSHDPLVGKGGPGMTRQSEEIQLAPIPASAPGYTGAPMQTAPTRTASISPMAGASESDPEAQAEYKAGYDAIIKGNYQFAADQFRQFLKRHPHDAQAPDATNWLGEALLQQKNYVDAADVLVNGYKSYPTSARAPDLLLKLGIALAGANQGTAACKTFGLLTQKFPDTTAAFRTRLRQEMSRDKCTA